MQPIVKPGKPYILVIEDNEDMREALETALTEAEFDVVTADTTERGLERFTDKQPDAILLDIITGSMHGSLFLRRLRELPAGKDCPVIVLTNLEDDHIKQMMHEYDIFAYLIKANTPLNDIVETVRGSLVMH
ncbi:MAG TPA: response regulator [Candidatus Paceibacterota bacterium]|nr:response regulator [Candidatus Paceibacterota bacterium]